MEFQSALKKDGIYEGMKHDAETNSKWKDMLVPLTMRVPGEEDDGQGLKLDLNTLLKVLDQHSNVKEEGHSTTWQLVVIQAILLAILILVAVAWACCCKRKCCSQPDEVPRVNAALRKLSSNASIKSRDYPPSYSQADLYTLAMSVQDYLYPPPDYPDVFNRKADDLAYLDLEGGHRRMSKLSFSNPASPTSSQKSLPSHGSGHHESRQHHRQDSSASSQILQGLPGANHHPALSRQSTWSSLTSSHAPLSRQSTWSSSSSADSRRSSLSRDSATSQRRKSSLKDPSSRRSSLTPDSRRGSQSRISFNESVECSNGSVRRLSNSQDLASVSRQSSSTSLPHLSRQSSTSSLPQHAHLSRQSSDTLLLAAGSGEAAALKSTLLASRKLGLSQESLNEALKKKLEAIEQEDNTEISSDEETSDNNNKVGNDQVIQIELDQPRISLETVIEVENH